MPINVDAGESIPLPKGYPYDVHKLLQDSNIIVRVDAYVLRASFTNLQSRQTHVGASIATALEL